MIIAELQADLRRAVLAGEDTAAIRAAIEAAIAAEARGAATAARVAEESAEAEAQALRTLADDLASASIERLSARMATLRPPAAPQLPRAATIGRRAS